MKSPSKQHETEATIYTRSLKLVNGRLGKTLPLLNGKVTMWHKQYESMYQCITCISGSAAGVGVIV